MNNDKQTYKTANLKLWNALTNVHFESSFYDKQGFLLGKNTLNQIELSLLPNLNNLKVLHLQCHFGLDSMSLSRMGAKVTGVDFSSEAIEKAKDLATELRLDTQFICCDVNNLKDHLDGQYDLIFTSYGVTTWLQDLKKWASVIHHFLKPRGDFLLVEFHPLLYSLDFNTGKVVDSLISSDEPQSYDIKNSYTGDPLDENHQEFVMNHSISQVITPLLEQSLLLLSYGEYDYSPYPSFPNAFERASREYVVKVLFGIKIPYVYALKCGKAQYTRN